MADSELTFETIPQEAVPIDNTPFASPVASTSSGSIFSFQYYRKYFDVTTSDVVARLSSALTPTNDRFLHDIDTPDLYGAVWVPATVSFLSFAFGVIASWANNGLAYNFVSLVLTSLVLFGFTFGFPFVVKYIDAARSPPLVNMMTLFGYSTVYVAISSFLFVIVRATLGTLCVLACAGAGAASVLFKMQYYEQTNDGRSKGIAISVWSAGSYMIHHVLTHFIAFYYT